MDNQTSDQSNNPVNPMGPVAPGMGTGTGMGDTQQPAQTPVEPITPDVPVAEVPVAPEEPVAEEPFNKPFQTPTAPVEAPENPMPDVNKPEDTGIGGGTGADTGGMVPPAI